VAVGASAGGLEAFIDLLSAIPAQTGLSFVLVQHLNPRHESMLAGILARAAAVPVQQVTDGMRIERDHVYVIPPDREMTISEGILRLAPRASEVPHRPLDNFFSSLANDQKSRAIGVVLSGNDADGSAGLQAIRDAGGITFAQDTQSAKFDVMPRSAASAADLVLPPREIAQQLVRVAQQYEVPETEAGGVPKVGEDAEAFERILELLRNGEQSVSELQTELEIEASSVSQQLAVLRAKNIVDTRRAGTSVYYSVRDPQIFQLLDVARDIFNNHLIDLQAMLETHTRDDDAADDDGLSTAQSVREVAVRR